MPKIPDDMWKCPKCGAGYENGDGLIGPDYTTEEEYIAAYGADDEFGGCECQRCGWSGHPKKVYEKAMKKANKVKCPCCKGTGWVNEATNIDASST